MQGCVQQVCVQPTPSAQCRVPLHHPPHVCAELCMADDEYAATCERLTPILQGLGQEVSSADFFRCPYL